MCASAQGTLCHQREPAPPPRWSFLYPSTVIQATLVRNRNLVFLPLYGTPSEGTLHFEIQLGPVTPVSVPPWCGGGLSVLHKRICGSQGACHSRVTSLQKGVKYKIVDCSKRQISVICIYSS